MRRADCFFTERRKRRAWAARHWRNCRTFELSHSRLDVCTNEKHQIERQAEPINCTWCDKCIRTMATLDHFGLLERYSSQFGIDFFRQHRAEHLARMMQSPRPLNVEVGKLIGWRPAQSPVEVR